MNDDFHPGKDLHLKEEELGKSSREEDFMEHIVKEHKVS